MPRLILASQSPRRIFLFDQLRVDFDAIATDEVTPPIGGCSNHEEIIKSLAEIKARTLLERSRDAIVVGAHTMISLGDELIGKPKDADEARMILKKIQGTRHRILTGLAVLSATQEYLDCDGAEIDFRPMTDEDIEAYLTHPRTDWHNKTGSYALQGFAGRRFVERYTGNYNAATGLPIKRLQQILQRFDIHAYRPTEKLMVVDEYNQTTGFVKDFLTLHEHGDWHRVTAVYVLNRDGHILCHERASHLYHDPGHWEPYIGGHIRYTETPLQNAIRELSEELGITATEKELRSGPVRKSNFSHEWIYSFVYHFSGDMEHLQFVDQEVKQITFLPYERIVNSMEKEPERWGSRLSSLRLMRKFIAPK